MRTIVTFVVVLVVLNAAIRAGTAYWKYYQLKDAAQEIALFAGNTPTSVVHQQVIDKADKLELPIGPDDVSVVRDGNRTEISASYVQPVEFLPRYYTRDLAFKFSVEATASKPSIPADIVPGAMPQR